MTRRALELALAPAYHASTIVRSSPNAVIATTMPTIVSAVLSLCRNAFLATSSGRNMIDDPRRRAVGADAGRRVDSLNYDHPPSGRTAGLPRTRPAVERMSRPAHRYDPVTPISPSCAVSRARTLRGGGPLTLRPGRQRAARLRGAGIRVGARIGSRARRDRSAIPARAAVAGRDSGDPGARGGAPGRLHQARVRRARRRRHSAAASQRASSSSAHRPGPSSWSPMRGRSMIPWCG